jgi:cell division protein FtsB
LRTLRFLTTRIIAWSKFIAAWGETEKAQQETGVYKLASEKKNQQVEQERHELQQFVYTLREQGAAAPKESPPKTADPSELQWVGG